MTDKRTYRLKDGIDRVARSGLVLEGDEEIETYPGLEREHGDVLERVDDDATAAQEVGADADAGEHEDVDVDGDDQDGAGGDAEETETDDT